MKVGASAVRETLAQRLCTGVRVGEEAFPPSTERGEEFF